MNIPEAKMANMCETCAYRNGSRPNLDNFTRAKRITCEVLCEPFMCHSNRDIDGVLLPGEPEAVCAGWVVEVERRIDSGYYKTLPEEKRRLFASASKELDLISEAISLKVLTQK